MAHKLAGGFQILLQSTMIQDTPEKFIVPTNHTYPPHNEMIFEEYFYERFYEENIYTDRIYLPILWTNYYISKNYCNDDMSDLQDFLGSLSRAERYFTVVQWDDGIVNDISDLDILSFSSGGVGDYPIPLINQPPPIDGIKIQTDILRSFIGCINGRHSIREKMAKVLEEKPSVFISENITYDAFLETMLKSLFALCPRGYGKTSFRINEALQCMAVPVYIYDDPWIPFPDGFDFEDIGILIHEDQIEDTYEIITSKGASDIHGYMKRGREVYKEFFDYEGCFRQIVDRVDL